MSSSAIRNTGSCVNTIIASGVRWISPSYGTNHAARIVV